jgi:hypothetical protein
MKNKQIIRELREEIARLQEEIRQINEVMVEPNGALAGILSRQQATLLSGVVSRQVATYAYIDQILANRGNFNRKEGEDLEKLRSKVAIFNLRKKLKPHGIEIFTWRGIGYYMSDGNKEKLRKLMEKNNDLMDAAADRIEKLEPALRSIAANACCDSCREAALVARKALEGKDE